jgi:multiple sugar transport system ATP-binding protein
LSQIELHHVSKSFVQGMPALEAIDLVIREGERVLVLGPSGSGKTTLLRLIAGLETPTNGTIQIDGRDMDGVPPHRRDVAMVFQNPALYPHLNVFANMAFSLKARGVSRAERQTRVAAIAAMLGLQSLLKRRPAELSGGERQRVALGRAVVRRPRVLLLDEPFSGLDLPLRTALRQEVVELHQQFGSTLVHVTHDQGEALSLGQRVAVLDRGRLIQVGPPREIYDRPADRFVASFVGSPGMNFLPCELVADESRLCIRPIGIPHGEPPLIIMEGPTSEDLRSDLPRRIDLGIRPESITVVDERTSSAQSHDPPRAFATVRQLVFQGDSVLATLSLGATTLVARLPTATNLREGQRVVAQLDLRRASWFDPATGRRRELTTRPAC